MAVSDETIREILEKVSYVSGRAYFQVSQLIVGEGEADPMLIWKALEIAYLNGQRAAADAIRNNAAQVIREAGTGTQLLLEDVLRERK